jgi:hypothetical protein
LHEDRAAGALYNTVVFMTLGVPVKTIGLMWLIEEISILAITPFIGLASDRSEHPMGRRRLYILFSLTLGVVGLVAFPWAGAIGDAIGGSENADAAGIAVAAISWMVRPMCSMYRARPGRALLLNCLRSPASLAPSGLTASNRSRERLWRKRCRGHTKGTPTAFSPSTATWG